MYDHDVREIDRVTAWNPDQTYAVKIERRWADGQAGIGTDWLTIGTDELRQIRAIFARRES